MTKKEEEIKDIFADLKTIVNTDNKIIEEPEEKPKKKSSHTGIKIGIIFLIIILFIGSVVAGYFIYKSSNNGLLDNPEIPEPLDDQNQGEIFNQILPIIQNPGLPNNNNTPPLTDPNSGDTNTTPPGTGNRGGRGSHNHPNDPTPTDPCLDLGTVTFSPTGTIYYKSVDVTLNYTKSLNATHPECQQQIRYTLDGKEPNLDSLLYTSPITISEIKATAVKAKVFGKNKSGNNIQGNTTSHLYIIRDACSDLDEVKFNYASGTYYSPITLSLSHSSNTPNCQYTIKYTNDETEPKTTSITYTGPMTISSTTTIKTRLMARNTNGTEFLGPITSEKYTINMPTDPCANLGSVTFIPEEETYTEPITVDMKYTHTNTDCEFSIHYTLDGTNPTQFSTKYTGGGIRISETKTFKAAVFAESTQGPVSEKTYTINVPIDPCANLGEVKFNPKGATYNYTPIALYLETTNINPNCLISIHYTTDGSEPKNYSPEYSPNTGISLMISENNPITVKATIFSNTMPQYQGPTGSETYRYAPEVINK